MAETPVVVKTVMVVEDDEIARIGLTTILTQHGYAVTFAPNGRVALGLLTGGPTPDVILLDMVMPEMDGWAVLDALSGPPYGSVPVIVTTGTVVSPEWAAEHGCAGFLRKPFDVDELLAEVGRVVRPS